MRLLVLGGTSFLSKATAAEAVRRGHEVVCAARGRSGVAPDGARLLVLDRDEPGAAQALAREEFDAVVDVATLALPWVRDALAALADSVGHWTFVSSVNAYADTATMGQTADAPVHDPITDSPSTGFTGGPEQTPEHNGGVKAACENAVRDAVGADRAFIVRPGQISGPGDYMDRFGYWPARLSRGGRVVVPDDETLPFQHIDVRDLAAWIVTAGEDKLSGVYDSVTPARGLRSTLADIAALVAPAGTELVPVEPEALTAAGVGHWGGPGALPLWLPPSHYGMASHDAATAYAAGLTPRPLADTVRDTLVDERARGLDRPRLAGITADQEAALLAV